MRYIILWLLCLCLSFSPFGGFSFGIMNLMGSMNNKEEVVEDVPEPVATPEPTEEPQGRNIVLNNTLDLDGYCTIRIPSEYYTITDDSTFTKKVIRYNDKKSKITMSYLTNISEDADIPGYITRESAGLDIVTNSKHDVEYESGTWTVIPANKVIDGCYPTVYYITSDDETTAFWMRVNMHESADEEEFNEVLEAIINSYNMYYIGGTVFDTPTGGYYADHEVEGQGLVADSTDYKKNNTDNNVWDSEDEGFDRNADIALRWDSMEIIIDDNKLTLPCSLKDVNEAGFTPNDNNVKSGTYYIDAGSSKTIQFMNQKGTMIELTFLNESNTELQDISECSVVKMDIDTSEFLAVVENSSSDENSEENSDSSAEDSSESSDESSEESENSDKTTDENSDSDENSDETSDENTDDENSDDPDEEEAADPVDVMDGEKVFDNITHSVILPHGLMLNAYTQDILDCYGEPNDKYRSDNRLKYTWKKDEKYLELECGVVKNIKHITLSVMDNL